MYDTIPAVVKIGMCSLNNNPLDFGKNRDNIIQSINRCKKLGCSIRVGNQMEISGYLCADHLLEYDTNVHTWEIIRDILSSGVTNGIVCDIGCGIVHNGDLYNCRVILLDSKIKGIRAKMNLAENSGYFQNRWFSIWKQKKQISEFILPAFIQQLTGQTAVPIGQFLIQFNDTLMAFQVCQQAWTPHNPMIDAALNGAEIFINPAFSYIQRGKLKNKMNMFRQFTDRYGGSYLYINAKGAQGQRTYMIGDCIFTQNGQIKNLAPINNLDNMSITPAMVNLTSIRANRLSNKSFTRSTKGVPTIPKVIIQINVANCKDQYIGNEQQQIFRIQKLIQDYQFPHARFEPSLFLWDYLRKSKARGFFLALQGDIDSTAVAMTVYNMCELLYRQISQNNMSILKELRIITQQKQLNPKSPQDICNHILFTCFMRSQNSSESKAKYAEKTAKTINSKHQQINFDKIYESQANTCREFLGINLNSKIHNINNSIHNMQSRYKMMISYLLSQNNQNLLGDRKFLFVLTALSLDDQLIGNFTKYGTAAGDINPIGSFSDNRIREFLNWNYETYKFQFLKDITTPAQHKQLITIGHSKHLFSSLQLSLFGKLRRVDKLGPLSMFTYLHSSKILHSSAQQIAEKVKQFFRIYSKNRHKMLSTTLSFYFNPEDCYDNRSDVRPMYYNTDWSYQFDLIDQRVKQIIKKQEQRQKNQNTVI